MRPEVNAVVPGDGWRLTPRGGLVPGSTGRFVDESGLYILRDGRRVSAEIVNRDRLGHLLMGKDSREEGLEELLGRPCGEPPGSELKAAELFRDYHETMPDLVYQAFQLNICRNQGEYEIRPGVKFFRYGFGEAGIPLVAAQTGRSSAAHTVVIGGPHGDERCALRLILMAQRHFAENPGPAFESDSVFYFIPALGPAFYFAGARGLPLGDLGGMRSREALDRALRAAVDHVDISRLHDDIIKCVEVPESPRKKETLRTAIQSYNRHGVFTGYPRYGIDTNRDFLRILPSIRNFYNFVEGLGGKKTVILLHGYDSTKSGGADSGADTSQGCVYPQYFVQDGPGGKKARLYPGRRAFCGDIRRALNWDKPQLRENSGEEDYLYLSTEDDPDYYRGEIIRHFAELTPREKKIYAFDLELPHDYDEGKRKPGLPYYQHYDKALENLGRFAPVFYGFLRGYHRLQDREDRRWDEGQGNRI